MTAKSERKSNQSDQSENFDIQDLTKLLQGDLTSVDLDTAMAAIEHYQSALKKSDDQGLEAIATHLKELKALLKSGKADGATIAEALTQLGEQTETVADGLEKDAKSQVQKLSKALTKVGEALAAESDAADDDDDADEDSDEDEDEDEDDRPDVDALLDTLKGDVTSIEPTEGTEAIDEWLDVLKASKDDHIKAIANSLKELKKLLKGKKTEGSDIAEILTKLGEQTESFAANADKEIKGKVQKLGKALTKAGKAIK